MKSLGLVVEYNPFHNGHLYHLQQAKEVSRADVTIAVMSGNFLQRGEPALVSKWYRTRMALEAGVDLVIELPYAYATHRADRFAYGAIALLDALGTDEVIFGSESGNIQPFLDSVEFINNNEEEYNELIQAYIKTGMSYPAAVSSAFEALPNRSGEMLDLSKPNNILGFHYVDSVRRLHSSMSVNTVKRTGAGYHDEGTEHDIASATGIRKILFEGDGDRSSIERFVPDTTYRLLEEHWKTYNGFLSWENYFPLLKYRLITASVEELAEIYDCSEGIENRLKAYIRKADSFKAFIEAVKTKRYTWTRLQRICTHILTNATKVTMEKALTDKPPYIRLLGMNERGQNYLSQMKKQVEYPIVSTLSKFENATLEQDIQASATYSLGYPSRDHSTLLKNEYATPPIRLNTKT
ncbi:nucleotidyltransferase [Pseudalkalibacillus sp. SCS-8]|uniref:nucleotidyltransferase n=1 Tax=Pseudalkalibacillus nanhaiensis TaxID=3115291 RepID=UPI0032DB5543